MSGGGTGDSSQDCTSILEFLTSGIRAGAFSMEGGPSEAAALRVRCRAEGLERRWVGSKRVLVLLLLPGLCGRSSWCAKTRDGLWNAPGLGTAGLQAAIHTNVSLPGPLLSSHCSPHSVFWSRV